MRPPAPTALSSASGGDNATQRECHSIELAAPGLAILAAGAPQPGERPEVQVTRERGWSLTSGEILPGATGVAAAIAVPGHPTEACISAVWVDDRDPVTCGESVVRAARAIAAGGL